MTGAANVPSHRSPKRPNLLYILTDQQRFDSMKAYGNSFINTPAFDSLAEQSLVFENAYVSQPVCTPSRATQLTGMYPHTNRMLACNIPLAESAKTIAEIVPDDYTCGYFGKWHLGDEIFPQHGFSVRVSTEDTYRRFYSKPELYSELSDYHRFLVSNGYTPDAESCGHPLFSRHFTAQLEPPQTKAMFMADAAERFIHQHTADPFVLYLGFLEPHPPHTGPYNSMYDADSFTQSPNFMKKPGADCSLLHRLMSAYYMESEEYGCDLRTDEGWHEVQRRYWGNVTLVDRAVGRILQALEDSAIVDSTIVVFTSEHGEMLGNHGILGKTVLYEEAVKVPMLLKVPWLNRSSGIVEGNYSHVDTLPTLLDLMGIPIPVGLDGESLVRSTSTNTEIRSEATDIFIEWNEHDGHPMPGEAEVNRALVSPARCIISTDRWKLLVGQRDSPELYDLNDDPYELTNLARRPEHAAKLHELARRLSDWQIRTRDKLDLPLLREVATV